MLPTDFEQQLGFDRIREWLKNRCLSPAGEAALFFIRFAVEEEEITLALRQTDEFSRILNDKSEFPSTGFVDVRSTLEKLKIEDHYAGEPEFVQLSTGIRTILGCRQFLDKNKSDYPSLYTLIPKATIRNEVLKWIDDTIDDRGEIRDGASAVLRDLRRDLGGEETNMKRAGDRLFRELSAKDWIPQGAGPTIREGRFVIPVLMEYKRKVQGLMIDESASGQTAFIEPSEMLVISNRIRELKLAVRREEIRILTALSNRLRTVLDQLVESFDFLAYIEVIRAKALVAIELKCMIPEIVGGPALEWRRASHPLLASALKGKRDVVPLDIVLDPENRMLLISGPNAGGKSVCLKTVALLQYMFQCGMLVPVGEGSRFGIFHDILVDIGDHQSIDNDLSTYSSHLKNMAAFVSRGTGHSLVLMDELGSGTDPKFGGAIAQAVLSALLECGVWGAATTHYHSLKVFASECAGICNAAMRFDQEKLEPLFVLDIGKPGGSYAFEIARKAGLTPGLLEEAQRIAGQEAGSLEDLLREVEQEKTRLDQLMERNRGEQEALEQTLAVYKNLLAELEEGKKEIMSAAREEAQQLLREANREIETVIRKIKENRAEKTQTRDARQHLDALSERVGRQTSPSRDAGVIRKGDHVRISGQQGSGVVLSVKGKKAMVQFGELTSSVSVTMLEQAGGRYESTSASSRKRGVDSVSLQKEFSGIIDLRGKRAEEVRPLVERFLDTAVLLGVGEVQVIHGKGGGVLRKIVHDMLKENRHVKAFHHDHPDRGGDGITVVKFS